MKTVKLADAERDLRSIIDQLGFDSEITILSDKGTPGAVLMSVHDYNGLMETLYLLSSPANAAHLARSIEQARAGYAKPRELIDA